MLCFDAMVVGTKLKNRNPQAAREGPSPGSSLSEPFMPCLLTTPREQGGSLLNPGLLQLLILECVNKALLKGILKEKTQRGRLPKEAGWLPLGRITRKFWT